MPRTTSEPDYMTRLRRETKTEVQRMQAEIESKRAQLAPLQQFEQIINPATRPRRKRKKATRRPVRAVASEPISTAS